MHGGLAFITDQTIRLSEDLILPLSIQPGSQLWGTYYPPPERTNDYRYVVHEHDFMLTPIPYYAWGRVARIRIRMKHKKGTLSRISRVIATEGCNILLGELNRSGHRYTTWRLVVDFEKISTNLSEVDVPLARTNLLREKAISLRTVIEEKCSEDLFRMPDLPDMSVAVTVDPLDALLYFSERWRKISNSPVIRERKLFRPFHVEYQSDRISFSNDAASLFKQVLKSQLPT